MESPVPVVADPGPAREDGPLLQCPYCDSEATHKLAQFLLPGLAAVCVDSTTGDLFKSPSAVAVELRKEMVDYVTRRSETFIADALLESEASRGPGVDQALPDDPFEIVSVFMDDFSIAKRNLIGHVSGWLLSGSRDDKVDDFVQEMELTRFWPLRRREAIAEVLLKNVDAKTRFHCPEKHEDDRLAGHRAQCSFRPVACPNAGCRARVSVRSMAGHDAGCGFKVLACDMDRHCVTVCALRPIRCPFGCDASFPDRDLDELQAHLVKVLKQIHKKGLKEEELKERALVMDKGDHHAKLARALDARSLTNVVKDLEAKMKDGH